MDSGPSGTNRRLIFGVDATASREAAWDTARDVTDALLQALPGRLDVALAVHGGGRVHTFSEFASDAYTLRERAAGVVCEAGPTRLLPILKSGLSRSNVALVIYIGDAFEEDVGLGNQLCDLMGAARHQAGRVAMIPPLMSTPRTLARCSPASRGAPAAASCRSIASALDRLRDLLAALATPCRRRGQATRATTTRATGRSGPAGGTCPH